MVLFMTLYSYSTSLHPGENYGKLLGFFFRVVRSSCSWPPLEVVNGPVKSHGPHNIFFKFHASQKSCFLADTCMSVSQSNFFTKVKKSLRTDLFVSLYFYKIVFSSPQALQGYDDELKRLVQNLSK